MAADDVFKAAAGLANSCCLSFREDVAELVVQHAFDEHPSDRVRIRRMDIAVTVLSQLPASRIDVASLCMRVVPICSDVPQSVFAMFSGEHWSRPDPDVACLIVSLADVAIIKAVYRKPLPMMCLVKAASRCGVVEVLPVLARGLFKPYFEDSLATAKTLAAIVGHDLAVRRLMRGVLQSNEQRKAVMSACFMNTLVSLQAIQSGLPWC